MSSTTCFTKGHSTRIFPPCGSYRRVTERFGLRILFAGLLFVLLFGLFTVPVAGETTTVEVSTFEELQSEISSTTVEKTIIIAEDIMASEPLVIYSGQSITLLSDVETDKRICWAAASIPSSNTFGNGWVQVAGNLILSGNDSGATATNLTLEGSMDEGNGNSLVYVSGSFTLEDGAILTSNYISNSGAGVFISGGTFTMTGGEIHGCLAKDKGGGVYVSRSGNGVSSFEMTGGSICGNQVHGEGGGGVYISDGVFNMSGGEITENSATYYGGGIYQAGGSASLYGSASVTENSAELNGGIWVNTDISLTGNAKISGNTAISYHDASEIMTNAAVIQIAGSPTVGPNGVYLDYTTEYETGEVHQSHIHITGDVEDVSIENITLGWIEEDFKLVRWTGEKPRGISPDSFVLTDTRYVLMEDMEKQALVVTYNRYPNSYTLTFDANGGTGSMGSATVSAGESYTLPECTFTAPDGQVFKAWLIGSTEYAAGTSYTPTASVTVKAVWTVEDTTAPGIFTINPLENGIVSWTVSEGATGYKFSLRDRTISETEDTGKKVNNEDVGTATNYDISSYLVEGHSYRVAVCAYNNAGKETWVELEFVFGNCQHNNLADVDITYNEITKDFPQDSGDGTHYWYVNVVCDDCKEVQQENVKRNAEHNANTLEKNGVCECNYHRYETGLSYTMYAVEDANTYLAPEAEDGYRGGSIDKDEEVTVFSDRLGDDGSWSLIEYSVTGTSREKVRFVKSDVLVDTLEKGSITITTPTDKSKHYASENITIYWVVNGDITTCSIKLIPYRIHLDGTTGGGSLGYHEEDAICSDYLIVNEGLNEYTISGDELNIRDSQSPVYLTGQYMILIRGFDNSNIILDEQYRNLSIINQDVFIFPDDTWNFDNTINSFSKYLETGPYDIYANYKWEDFVAVYGDSQLTKNYYKEKKSFGGACFGMVSMIIAVTNNLFPIDGFSNDEVIYDNLYDFNIKDLKATHNSFDGDITSLGQYILRLQLATSAYNVEVVWRNINNNNYEGMLDILSENSPLMISLSKNGENPPFGTFLGDNHSVLGYAISEEYISDNGESQLKISIYDPVTRGDSDGYIMLNLKDGEVNSWEYVKSYSKWEVYNSDYHNLGFMTESDILEYLFFEENKFEIVDDNEVLYISKISNFDDVKLITPSYEQLINLEEDSISGASIDTYIYRIPKDEVKIQSSVGGVVIVSDIHSSVELTLDAGTTASVIVDDTKESSVEITSDVENQNHEFTVTYGYDSTADKGYQEATVKGTMSDSFKGEATENGLKLTGLESAEIIVENDKGESVSVGTIQNADEYEDIVIDIDTSVKVTGNKDGVSDVLVSVPLNKVQYESSSSYKDTGSGNYAEYPRTVTNGGYVDFGTSPVVKGVTLPEGFSGSVVLIAKSKTPAPEGKEAYGVFEINVASYPTGEKSVISFTIPLADLQKKGFTEKDICLYHFDGEVWTKLPTTYKVDGDKALYEAETTDFSPFAIVYEKDGAVSAVVSETPVKPEQPNDEPVSEVPEIPSSSKPQEAESPAPVLGVMLGTLGAAVLMRRK